MIHGKEPVMPFLKKALYIVVLYPLFLPIILVIAAFFHSVFVFPYTPPDF